MPQSALVGQAEPHAMTQAEWEKAKDEAMVPNHVGLSPSENAGRVSETERLHAGVKPPYDPDLGRALPVTHRDVVEQALAAGKTVPPEVLADYPDLKAGQVQPTPEPPAKPKPSLKPRAKAKPAEAAPTPQPDPAGRTGSLSHADLKQAIAEHVRSSPKDRHGGPGAAA